jgi:hypothetical protein
MNAAFRVGARGKPTGLSTAAVDIARTIGTNLCAANRMRA